MEMGKGRKTSMKKDRKTGMRKGILPAAMAVILCVFALIGCQEAPDAVEGNGILHAQGDLERQVQEIAGADTQERTSTGTVADAQERMQSGTATDAQGQTQAGTAADIQGQTQTGAGAGWYQGTVGTGDHKINISAEVPVIPDKLYIITLKPDEGLDRDVLLAFLDSDSGNVEDTSQELLREIEEGDRYNSIGDESGERFLYSRFGDHSATRLDDGTKEASFAYHTWAYYVDNALREKCFGIFGGNYSETLITPDRMDEGSFPADRAREILLDKLAAIGVGEFAIQKVYYIEGSDYSYYNMEFVPAYDRIAVDIGSDSYALGQVFPNGYAYVSQEGVAEVSLMNFCGKKATEEPATALSFEQILKILEQYLDNGMIQSDGKITYDRVELNYYPVPNPAPLDEMEYKSELVLTPIWHIYMPIDEYVDGGYGDAAGPSHICVNAVTGELVETD